MKEDPRDSAQKALDEMYNENRKLKEINSKLLNNLATLRTTYQKELNHLRDCLQCKQNSENFQFIDLKIFDGTAGFDESTMLIFNTKISQLQAAYMERIESLIQQNKCLQKDIDNFKAVSAPNSIPPNEMNADGFISRLAVINEDPKNIFDALNKHFGSAWMQRVIEKEYFLQPDIGKNLEMEFDVKLEKVRQDAEQQMNSLSIKYNEKNKILTQDIESLKEENAQLISLHKKEIDRLKKEIDDDIAAKIKIREKTLIQMYEEENIKIRQDNQECELMVGKLHASIMIKRWGYLNALLKISQEENTETKKTLLQQSIAIYSGKIEQYANESLISYTDKIKSLTEEKYQLQLQLDEGSYENYKLKKTVNYYVKQGKDTHITNADLEEKLRTQRDMVKMLEIRVEETELLLSQSKHYVATLESQLNDYVVKEKQQSKQEMHTYSKANKQADYMREKAQISLSSQKYDQISTKINMVSEHTITNMYDINLKIDTDTSYLKPPMKSQQSQCNIQAPLYNKTENTISIGSSLNIKLKRYGIFMTPPLSTSVDYILAIVDNRIEQKEDTSFITQMNHSLDKLNEDQISVIKKHIKMPNPSKSIIRPVYKIIPFNIHSLENLLYRRANISHSNCSTQTEDISHVISECYSKVMQLCNKELNQSEKSDLEIETEKENVKREFRTAYKVLKKSNKFFLKSKRQSMQAAFPERVEYRRQKTSDFNIRFNGIQKLKMMKRTNESYNSSKGKYLVVGRPATSCDSGEHHSKNRSRVGVLGSAKHLCTNN